MARRMSNMSPAQVPVNAFSGIILQFPHARWTTPATMVPWPKHRGMVLVSKIALTDPSRRATVDPRSEEHTSELQSLTKLVCRLLLEKKNEPAAGHHHGRRQYSL